MRHGFKQFPLILVSYIIFAALISSSCQFQNYSSVPYQLSQLEQVLKADRAYNLPSVQDRLQTFQMINPIKDQIFQSFDQLSKIPFSKLFKNKNGQILDLKKVLEHQIAFEAWFTQTENIIKPAKEIVLALSKYETEKGQTVESDRNYSVLLFALFLLKTYYETIPQVLAPLALSLGHSDFNYREDLQSFRNSVLEKLFFAAGMTIVLGKDLISTMNALKKSLNPSTSPKKLRNFASNFFQMVKNQNTEKIKLRKKQFAQMPTDTQTKLREVFQTHISKLKDYSFLYQPGQDRYLLLDFASIVSNLTWGGINTALGVIIVAAAIVMIPFTFGTPSFNFSKNGRQIYVEISAVFSYFRDDGKMSMGLFEFDSTRAWSWYSAHEGGHALQSAFLGPLYLPAVLLSYSISGFDKGFIEDWATLWGEWAD